MRHFFCDSLKRILMACALTIVGIFSAHAATLPSGYTELEYIESTGTQYIDTGYIPSMTDTLTTVIKSPVTLPDSGTRYLYGTRDSYKQNGFAVQMFKSFYLQYGNTDTGNLGQLAANTDYTIVQTGPTYSVNGNSFTSSGTAPVLTRPLYLFTINNGGVAHDSKVSYRLYSFTVKNSNNSYKVNFVPAKNASGVIGMYDTVRNEFYTNAGTGTFTAGPEVPKYTYLEYIESTGTQWIDTGLKGNLNTKVEIDMQIPNYTSSSVGYFMGSRTAQNENAFLIGSNDASLSQNGKYFAQFDSVTPSGTGPTFDLNRHVLSLSSSGFYVDNQLYISYSNPQSFTTQENIPLFARYSAGTLAKGAFRVFSFKMYNNNTLVRDMVPAKNASGVVGMYDRANNVFYTNQGTGTFTAGPDLPEVTIKIATTKYTEDAFAGLMTTLSEAITKVTNIVDTTVQQATEIGNLATTKQDRPETDCPAGRKCLLIMGADNKPHWYLIQE